MDKFNKDSPCPQQCGGASEAKYHDQYVGGNVGIWGCLKKDWPLPHMHRTCNKCGYEWAEEPVA